MPNMNFINNSGQIKSIDFTPWGGIDGFLDATSNNNATNTSVVKLRKIVPWLNKAIRMTANAVSQLPYSIARKGAEDAEMDIDKAWGGVKNPQTLISLLAASLCGGSAYLKVNTTSKAIIMAQYLVPQTMMPNFDGNGELINFTRSYNGKKEVLALEEVVYFWLPDDTIETGAAQITPIGNAMLSAGLIAEMDNTLFQYGKRGFIPPAILAVKGMTNPSDVQKTETWWNAFLRGWTKQAAKIINAEVVTPQIMGAGMEEMKGSYIEITQQQIKNIAAAFGIPNSTFISDENSYATAISDLKLWYGSSEFVSIYQTIEDSLSDQLFSRFGWDMEYEPEQIEAFQQEETDKSGALSTLANSIDTQPEATLIAAEILGYDLTDEQIAAIQELGTEEPAPEPVDEIVTQRGEAYPMPTDEENEMAAEMMAWRKFAEKPRKREFETKHIPSALALRINAGLRAAKSQDEIQAVFDDAANELPVIRLARAIEASV